MLKYRYADMLKLSNDKGAEVKMNNEKLFKTIDESFDEYLSFWEQVCNIESQTSSKEGVDAAGKCFTDRAQRLGFEIEYHREEISGDAICITLNPSADGRPIVFSAHLDTVHPKGFFGYPPVKIEDGIIRGPGVIDCKGGAVSSLMAMEALMKIGFTSRPVKLILQSDEEISSITSGKRTIGFMAEKSKNAAAFLNCEPCVGTYKITVARKGIIRYFFEIHGRAFHSSACYEGANAVTEAAYKIIELEKWKDKDGITCNCGVIKGGTVPNSVAERCEFYADIRYKSEEELALVKERVEQIASTSYVEGTECTLSVKSERVAMPISEQALALAQRLNEISAENGLPVREVCLSNGGSDAADMSSRGILAVDSLGVMGGYMHSVKEYAYTESLLISAKLLALAAIEL